MLYFIRPLADDRVYDRFGDIEPESAVFKGSDKAVEENVSPSEAPVRKEFPESWIWVDLNKYDRLHFICHQNYAIHLFNHHFAQY